MAKYTFEDEKIELNPFWKDFKNYKIKFFRNDLRAAFYISLISIPQSIAYSILAGLPLSAGIFSAIFGVMIASIFCSSKHLIAGPSTGISILLQSSIANIISTYDLTNIGSKDEIVSYILTMMMIMIAIIQIISAFLQVGKLIYFISRAVILGYFVGVSVAIIINQLFLLFDIKENAALFSIFNKMTYLITNITNINMINLNNYLKGGITCL